MAVLQTESMSPICLPQFNPAAFLHAYIHYLHQVRVRCLVT